MELLTLAVESILVMRGTHRSCLLLVVPNSSVPVYVLFNQNRLILRIIIVLFAAEIILMVVALAISFPHIDFTPHCLTSGTPDFFMAYWYVSAL